MDNYDEYMKLHGRDETFVGMLLRLIKESGCSEVEIYKRANVDRKYFSKLRCDNNYKPKKNVVIAFVLALHLDGPTCKKLVKKAGYILSGASKFDLTIRYCVDNKIYDLQEVNQLLYSKGLPLI